MCGLFWPQMPFALQKQWEINKLPAVAAAWGKKDPTMR